VLPLYPQLQAYLRDLPNAEIHVHDRGHFGLEEEGGPMTEQILTFLGTWLR
jgi:hypothetical protein